LEPSTRLAFLLLVAVQACHSIEEYVFRLYEVFAPARFISGLVSSDIATGFAIINAGLVAFGAWCYIARVRVGSASAPNWVLLWVVIELANGVTHPAIAMIRGAYFPGVATAPLLLVLAAYLAYKLRSAPPSGLATA
jgi:hypothetical protein